MSKNESKPSIIKHFYITNNVINGLIMILSMVSYARVRNDQLNHLQVDGLDSKTLPTHLMNIFTVVYSASILV